MARPTQQQDDESFLVPLALVGPVDARLGLLALCLLLLTSLVGVLAASLGAPRLTSGVPVRPSEAGPSKAVPVRRA